MVLSDERAWQLAAIVESSNDSIVATDLARKITAWNRAAERLYGYTAGEVLGMPIAACTIPSECHSEEIDIFNRICEGRQVEPFHTIRRHKDGRLLHVSLSVSPIRDIGGQIIGASSISRDITDEIRNAERIKILAREAEHRTKNVLQAVQTVVQLSEAHTPKELKRVVTGRIQALANAHALLAETRWVGADLSQLARQELLPYLERTRIDGPPISVQSMVAQAIAMVLHELATNAAKYGALSVSDGRIAICWRGIATDRLLLTWNETGGPIVVPPTRRGFGMEVMETLIKLDLGGELRFNWRAEGLLCGIELKV